MITYMDVLKANAKINVEFEVGDVAALQGILLRHLSGQNDMDQKSYDVINTLCGRIDQAAIDQNQMVTKEINL